MSNVINKTYDGVPDEETADSTYYSPLPRRVSRNNQQITSPNVTAVSSSLAASPSTIISEITFQSLDDEETKTWTPLQKKKIILETATLETALGTEPCCNYNCTSQFTLDRIKAKRYSFYHLDNANKRYHLNLCRQMSTSYRSRSFIIDGKRCCIDCVTKVTGVSRNLLYRIGSKPVNKPLNTKSSKIAIWLMDLAKYSDKMPDNDEYHIPFMNKVSLC
jgi:hypothetical protein